MKNIPKQKLQQYKLQNQIELIFFYFATTKADATLPKTENTRLYGD